MNTDSLNISDSAAIDSAATDTIPVGEKLLPIVVSKDPEGMTAPERPDTPDTASWILVAVIAVVAVVAARYKSNIKYLNIILHDLTNVRERSNIFDDTANETSFMFLLNVLCGVSSGLMLYTAMRVFGVITATATTLGPDVWACIGAGCLYSLVMPVVYWCVGMVFSDSLHTRLWMKGFYASQALLCVLLLGPALVAFFYPGAAKALTITALCILAIIKLLFIGKTFRFFFSDYSSWVLFLYYLCTLEILPLILTYCVALSMAE